MSEQAQPVFNIQRVYLKDLSLELPNAPHVFLEQDAPKVEVAINVDSSSVTEGIYEVQVTATVTTKVKDQVAFLVEAKQAGIFEVRGVPAEEIDPLLGIVCPNILYPYLRSNIADAISRASFPPIHLAEINFQAFYEQRMSAAAQQEAAQSVANGTSAPSH